MTPFVLIKRLSPNENLWKPTTLNIKDDIKLEEDYFLEADEFAEAIEEHELSINKYGGSDGEPIKSNPTSRSIIEKTGNNFEQANSRFNEGKSDVPLYDTNTNDSTDSTDIPSLGDQPEKTIKDSRVYLAKKRRHDIIVNLMFLYTLTFLLVTGKYIP